MRNLRTVAFEEAIVPPGLPLAATAWDAGKDSLVCAFGPTPAEQIIELKRKTSSGPQGENSDGRAHPRFESIASWDAPCPLPDLACDEILLLQYFPDTATTCLVLAGGDLVVVREEPLSGQEKIEIVGSVDAGIYAAAWAPDEELLAIVTRADTLILMSREFEPVNEAALMPDDLKASKHVSIGWGKKETQFHGKRAKALRDPTMPESVDEGKLSSCDDGRASISWRGDGAFLAVNSTILVDRRVIRVFTREAVLDSASEPVNGLEGALSWRPSGNLIAGIQRLDDRIDVVFFERNGLRHGQFPLRISRAEMETWGALISLSWNLDSSVLAIMFKDRVQLWTMGNYHYYLKQEIPAYTNAEAFRPLALRWHPEQPLTCLLNASTTLMTMKYCFAISKGSTVSPNDHGSVAVIDGNLLNLTPLRHANVPPPMAFCKIIAGGTIIDCTISKSGQHIALLTERSLEVHCWENAHDVLDSSKCATGQIQDEWRPATKTNICFKQCLTDLAPGYGTRYTQIRILEHNEILLFAPPQRGRHHLLQRLIWKSQLSSTMELIDVAADVQNILTDIHCDTLWWQSSKRTVAVIEPTSNSPLIEAEQELPGGEPQTEIVRIGRHASNCKISMSSRGELLANGSLLARGCTSFLATDQYLIFTTSQHHLKFVHLAEPDQMNVPKDTPEIDERCRTIERGATLVTVVPCTYAVILQMPRGNLETIYPRILVLAGIRRHLLERDYHTAFVACQNHQVDLNILHDYNPDLFMGNLELFIDMVKKPSRVNEFLSKLKEEDVSQTMYKDTLHAELQESLDLQHNQGLPNGGATQPVVSSSAKIKINRICDAFIPILQSKGPRRLQNLITAYVSKRPPDLIAAIALISQLRKSDSAAADIAVSHLIFLTDASRLYNVCLSIYDLDLTIMVAQHAQMDPREYLPFLDHLHALEPLRRQFEIDDHLRNHAKALASLHASGAHEQVEEYAVKHTLYATALELYKYSPAQLTSMTALYAQHLQSKSRFLDAAIAFESLGDYDSAYQSYALAHHWREALASATLVPLEDGQLRSLASSLATTLQEENRDYRSAATIHVDYLRDIPTASKLLCKGSYFAEATRVLTLWHCGDNISEIIDVGLAEKFGEIIELLADCKSQLNAQIPRIRELRQKKAEDPLAFFGGDSAVLDGGEGDVADNVSLAPTNASTAGGHSLFTRYGSNASKFGGTVMSNVSRKTSKTKRREERKRARGKKGSVYEEEYLVSSVARLIDRLNGVQEEVKRLVEGLLRRGMRERAKDVDGKMIELVDLCAWAKEVVWQTEMQGNPPALGQDHNVGGEGRANGADGVLWDSQMDVPGMKDAPTVKVWKTAGLLGN